MIHLINDYYMTADGNSYTVAKAVQRDAGKFSMNRARLLHYSCASRFQHSGMRLA